MKKQITIIMVVSAILIAGVFLAGCTQETGTVTESSTVPSEQVQAAATPAGETTAMPSGTPPADMQMNGTHQSGTPPEGMGINMTKPSGTPPADMQEGGERPSGEPPSGTPPSGTPPADA
jgi:hypothetical protein